MLETRTQVQFLILVLYFFFLNNGLCHPTFRGLLHLENASFGIEPLHNSSHFEHVFYPMDDVHQEPLRCGVSNRDMEQEATQGEEEEHPSVTQLLRVRRGSSTLLGSGCF